MRTIQHEEFEKKLDELEYYKNYDDEDTLDAIVNFIDEHAITYWGVVAGLFDHLVSYASYFDSVEEGQPYLLTLQHINGMINDITKRVRG